MKMVISGASRGLGYCLCREGVMRGYQVYGIVRDTAGYSRDQFPVSWPGQIDWIQADLGDELQVEAAVHRILGLSGGSVDTLVNCAARIEARRAQIEDLDLGAVRRCMEVNVCGAMKLIQGLLKALRLSPNPCIVNLSSSAACQAYTTADDYPYSISKAALNLVTAKLRQEFKGDKYMKVFSLHPGWMCTDMGGPGADHTPEEVAAKIFGLIEAGKISNHFIDQYGNPVRFRKPQGGETVPWCVPQLGIWTSDFDRTVDLWGNLLGQPRPAVLRGTVRFAETGLQEVGRSIFDLEPLRLEILESPAGVPPQWDGKIFPEFWVGSLDGTASSLLAMGWRLWAEGEVPGGRYVIMEDQERREMVQVTEGEI